MRVEAAELSAKGYGVHQAGEVQLLLARGMRVSGDARIEQAVLTGRGNERQRPQRDRVAIGIGGATTYKNVEVFVDHLKGDQVPVVVTTTTMLPDYQFGNYREQMMHAGAGEPYHVGAHSLPFEARAAFRLGDGSFTTGGNQERGKNILDAKGLTGELVASYEAGKVTGGTSAGAHMIGEVTSYGRELAGEDSQKNEGKASVIAKQQQVVDEEIPGIGLVKKIGLDTHFDARHRGPRAEQLVEAMTYQGVDIVDFGLPEGGGVIIYNNRHVTPFGHNKTVAYWQRDGVVDNVMLKDSVDILRLPREHTFYSQPTR